MEHEERLQMEHEERLQPETTKTTIKIDENFDKQLIAYLHAMHLPTNDTNIDISYKILQDNQVLYTEYSMVILFKIINYKSDPKQYTIVKIPTTYNTRYINI
jgi:hypothetical protein